jgi:hypothetical protein
MKWSLLLPEQLLIWFDHELKKQYLRNDILLSDGKCDDDFEL